MPIQTVKPSNRQTGALSSLHEAFAPLLSVLGANGVETPRVFESPSALREARKEISSLKGAAERLEKEKANREKAESEARKWREKAEAAEKTIGPMRQRAEKAEADLARHTREAEALAAAKLETRLAAEFTEWLGARRAAMLREVGPACAGEVGPACAGEISGGVAAATSGGASRRQLQVSARANSFTAGPSRDRHREAVADRPRRRNAQRAGGKTRRPRRGSFALQRPHIRRAPADRRACRD